MKQILAQIAIKVLHLVVEKFLTEERIEANKDMLLDWVEQIVTDSDNDIDDAVVMPIINVLR